MEHSVKLSIRCGSCSPLPFSTQRRIWSFHIVVLQRTAKKCTNNYNARAQLLFCSLNICLNSLIPKGVRPLASHKSFDWYFLCKRGLTCSKKGRTIDSVARRKIVEVFLIASQRVSNPRGSTNCHPTPIPHSPPFEPPGATLCQHDQWKDFMYYNTSGILILGENLSRLMLMIQQLQNIV